LGINRGALWNTERSKSVRAVGGVSCDEKISEGQHVFPSNLYQLQITKLTMGAAASVNVDHIPGIKEAYEAKKAEGMSYPPELAVVWRFH